MSKGCEGCRWNISEWEWFYKCQRCSRYCADLYEGAKKTGFEKWKERGMKWPCYLKAIDPPLYHTGACVPRGR